MTEPKFRIGRLVGAVVIGVLFFDAAGAALARPRPNTTRPRPVPTAAPLSKSERQDDSVALVPSKDLALRLDGQHKADALTHFVEGLSLEETGEMDRALTAYRKVLDLDPGQSELASRVAALPESWKAYFRERLEKAGTLKS